MAYWLACVLQSRGSIVVRPHSVSLQAGSLFPARGVAHVFSFFVLFSLGYCWRAFRALGYVRVLERHARPFVKKKKKKASPIARKGAFFSVFRDLHDFRIFLENYEIFANFFCYFHKIS